MGDEYGDLEEYCRPVHEVRVPDFHLGEYLVTQELWKAVMGNNPSYFQGNKRPVERISWDDIQQFVKKLNEVTKQMSGRGYRLPSEAEWEFAARGGIHQCEFRYSGSNKQKEVSWHHKNSYDETKSVGLKYPNELGLYDMSGNVWERCEDIWQEGYMGALDHSSAWMKGSDHNLRVVRGGSWINISFNSRVAYRYGFNSNTKDYDIGFRLAR